MDAIQRQTLQAELDKAMQERSELDTVIGYLSRRLGIEVPTTANGSEQTQTILDPKAHPAEAINQGQFYGYSSTKAARAVLEMVGQSRPLKTDELYAAVKKGGVQIKSKEVLYRSMNRDDDFLKVGRGLWGLSEWYPKRPKTQGDLEDEGADDGPDESGDVSMNEDISIEFVTTPEEATTS